MKTICKAKKTNDVTKLEKNNRLLAYKAACEGIVLLKNDNVLPLKDKRIAVYGVGAKLTVKGGTGSGEVNERYSVSIFEGLKNRGYEVLDNKWLIDCDEEYKRLYDEFHAQKLTLTALSNIEEKALVTMQLPFGRRINDDDLLKCKTAMYVIARQAGEGADKRLDRGGFDLTDIEKYNIKFLSNKYKNVIVVINSGSQMNISCLDEYGISCIIYYGQQGMEGGNALADILMGKSYPSAKLTDTWVNDYNDIPFSNEYSYLSGDTFKEYYHEGIYVGYRYFETFGVDVRYPFGFGLTYSKFDLKYKSFKKIKDEIRISISIKNIGKYLGKEVIQAYLRMPKGDFESKRLVSFIKTKELKIKEICEMELSFKLKDMSSFDEERAFYYISKGKYVLEIGNSIKNTKDCFVIEVKNDIILEKCRNLCISKDKISKLHNSNKPKSISSKLESITISQDDVKIKDHIYKKLEIIKDDDVLEIMNKLSLKDKVNLMVGDTILCMFKSKGIVCPGSVGRTSDKLFKKGLINVNLADGPAGLRILKEASFGPFFIKMGSYVMSFMELLPSWIFKPLMINKEKDQILYQYCSAFPTESSLAQSWNVELLNNVGKAISLEMKEYGVTYWLAPALNIHRNPLCGRNFEYLSEDPLLSGKLGSSLCKGISSIKGNYATVKHFACNNQEDNRNKSNSILDERVLREIYLKPFEICIKEARPKALMTSYNLINDIYAPNNIELIKDILMNEWGFDGVVMTDWLSTSKNFASPYKAIKSGNYLIMPGSNRDKRIIKKAYRNNDLSIEEIDASVSHIIRQILDSNVYQELYKK